MRVALIGSCVTRDVWRVAGLDATELHFTARTSFISLMSPAPPGADESFCRDPQSAFERNCLIADIRKTSLAAIEAFEPDVLLLDFIDDRFDIVQIGAAFVHYTAELQLAGGFALSWLRAGTILDRIEPRTSLLWINSAKLLLGALARSPALAHVPIVLHRAPYAMVGTAGPRLGGPTMRRPELCHIAPGKVVSALQYDMLMRCYHQIFEALAPRTRIVEAPAALHVGADDHVWGASPFHYVDDYYECIAERLRAEGVV